MTQSRVSVQLIRHFCGHKSRNSKKYKHQNNQRYGRFQTKADKGAFIWRSFQRVLWFQLEFLYRSQKPIGIFSSHPSKLRISGNSIKLANKSRNINAMSGLTFSLPEGIGNWDSWKIPRPGKNRPMIINRGLLWWGHDSCYQLTWSRGFQWHGRFN